MDLSITLQQLKEWNSQGLIPGTRESEEEFKKRVVYSLQLKERIKDMIEESIIEPNPIIDQGFEITQEYYDIRPTWVPIFYSNLKLAPWHGGCTWIFQENDKEPTSAFLQLRKSFLGKETHLKMYHRNELISHELAHIGRMMLQEPKFEELIAYKTSPSKFRRWFGPLIQSSWEGSLLVILLLLILLTDLLILFFEPKLLYSPILWLKTLPVILLTIAFIRLWIRQSTFSQCQQRVEKAISNPKKVLAIMFRLTDREIEEFAKLQPEQIAKIAKDQKEKTLRWRLIYESYFKTN